MRERSAFTDASTVGILSASVMRSSARASSTRAVATARSRLWISASSTSASSVGSAYSVHQRSPAMLLPCTGASVHCAGRSIAGFLYPGHSEQPPSAARTTASPIVFRSNISHSCLRDLPMLGSFLFDVLRRARIGKTSVDDRFVEEGNEENREESRREHPAHDAGADRKPRPRSRAARERERCDAEDERERSHQDRPEAQPRRFERGR